MDFREKNKHLRHIFILQFIFILTQRRKEAQSFYSYIVVLLQKFFAILCAFAGDKTVSRIFFLAREFEFIFLGKLLYEYS